jgi:DNA-binding transcriptional regulator YiaG
MKTNRSGRFNLGREIIAALRDTNRRIARGEPLTVRDITLGDFSPKLSAKDIQTIRLELGCSQGAFAVFLGVPLVTLSSWERGKRVPSSMALRFLHELRSDPDYWRQRMAKSLRIAG